MMNRFGQIFRRQFHFAFCTQKNKTHTTDKFSKMMKKYIDKRSTTPSSRKKTWYGHDGSFSAIPYEFQTVSRGPSLNKQKRAEYLAPGLLEEITQIINSGELDPGINILSGAVDILKVKVFPDFTTIHVYWKGSGTERDDKLEKLFRKNAAKLRYILVSERHMGKIPEIVFKKDISDVAYLEVERLLKIADMGKDYKPTTEFRAPFQKFPTLIIDEDLKSRIQSVENTSNRNAKVTNTETNQVGTQGIFSTGELSDALRGYFRPEAMDESTRSKIVGAPASVSDSFRNNLYGIPHDKLMEKLVSIKKGRRDSEQESLAAERTFHFSNLSGIKTGLTKNSDIRKHLRIMKQKRERQEKKFLQRSLFDEEEEMEILPRNSRYFANMAGDSDDELDDEDYMDISDEFQEDIVSRDGIFERDGNKIEEMYHKDEDEENDGLEYHESEEEEEEEYFEDDIDDDEDDLEQYSEDEADTDDDEEDDLEQYSEDEADTDDDDEEDDLEQYSEDEADTDDDEQYSEDEADTDDDEQYNEDEADTDDESDLEEYHEDEYITDNSDEDENEEYNVDEYSTDVSDDENEDFIENEYSSSDDDYENEEYDEDVHSVDDNENDDLNYDSDDHDDFDDSIETHDEDENHIDFDSKKDDDNDK